jgi:hypothetical protein
MARLRFESPYLHSITAAQRHFSKRCPTPQSARRPLGIQRPFRSPHPDLRVRGKQFNHLSRERARTARRSIRAAGVITGDACVGELVARYGHPIDDVIEMVHSDESDVRDNAIVML